MSEPRAFPENAAGSKLEPARSWSALTGLAFGALFGALFGGMSAGMEFLIHGWDLHQVALPTFLLLYPLFGFALGWLVRPHPHAFGWMRRPDFFSAEPLPPQQAEARGRRIRRSLWVGFAAGALFALLDSALDFAWRGWPCLTGTLIRGLVSGPLIGLWLGYNISLRPGDPKPSLRNLRFRMQTLMLFVAYLALILGLGETVGRYSDLAQRYQSKAWDARQLAAVFQQQVEKARVDVKRADHAKELRAGRIPEGLLPSQEEFLKGLEGNATESYKQYRYGLIADGEDRLAKMGASNLAEFSQLVAWQQQLAEKYAKATREPWVPVAPDPPKP